MTLCWLPTTQTLLRWNQGQTHSKHQSHCATSQGLPLLSPAGKYAYVPTVALLSAWWLPLNNKTENFLCPGNVPLVIQVTLISRPQRSKGRPPCVQDAGGIIAKKIFPTFFLCLEFKAWPLRVEFNQVISQMPQWGNKRGTGKAYCFCHMKVEMGLYSSLNHATKWSGMEVRGDP